MLAAPFVVSVAMVAAMDACNHRSVKPLVDATAPATKLTLELPFDGGSVRDCGATHAQCGTWHCQGNVSGACSSMSTSCVTETDGSRVVCAGFCCNAGFCSEGGATCIQDGGNRVLIVDGGPPCVGTPACAYGNTQLSNAVLGSAAQSQIGGVFCPPATFSINTLTDPSHCGNCATKCKSGYFCLNGYCTP